MYSSASLNVTKQCSAKVEYDVDSDKLVVKILVEGEVCNTGEQELIGLNIVDTPATDPNLKFEGEGMGVNLFLDKTTLPKGECSTYTGYYYPNIVPTGDLCPFPDTVTETAFAIKYSFGDGCAELPDKTFLCKAVSNTATCKLRVPCV